MDYKGFQRNSTDYRSSATIQPKAGSIDGDDVTSTKPPFGQYAPTVECRFPSPPPWDVILPPYPPVNRPPVFPRTPGSNFHVPPPDCGNWPANSLYEARQNFNAPPQFVNLAGARFSNTKECHDNSAPSIVQRNVLSQQRSSALAKEPYVQTPQGSINVPGNHIVNSDGFQTPHNVFPQQFTSPPPPPIPPLHHSYLAADISSQRFTIPPPNLSYLPRFDSSNQQSCFPKIQSHSSGQPRMSIQPSSCVRFQPQVPHHNQLTSFDSADDNCQRLGPNEFGAGLREFCDPTISQEFKRNAVNLQEEQADSGTSRIQSSSHHVTPWSAVSNKMSSVKEQNYAVNNFSNWNTVALSNRDIQTRDQLPVLTSDTLESKNDAEWIANWGKRKLSAAKSQHSGNPKRLSMTAFRSFLIEAIRLNDKLKNIIQLEEVNHASHCDQTTSDMVNPELAKSPGKDCIPSGSEGKIELGNLIDSQVKTGILSASVSSTVSAIQRQLKEIKSIITDEIVLATKEKLKKITKKRNRLKQKRQKDYEEKEENIILSMQRNKKIDDWHAGLQAEVTKLKKEKEIKMAADETLFEVRRKLTEARRALAVLANIRKLRNLRKDKASHKGMILETDSDAKFEERVAAQTDIFKQQIDMYELEERTLEVMLETEQEANMEREKKIQKRKEDERIQKFEKQLQAWLFGKEDVLVPSDPLYPYRQYYDIGSNNLGAFLRIRQEWDMYAVPFGTPGGSTVPFGWVAPVEPSSDAWASALKD